MSKRQKRHSQRGIKALTPAQAKAQEELRRRLAGMVRSARA